MCFFHKYSIDIFTVLLYKLILLLFLWFDVKMQLQILLGVCTV